MKVLPRVWDYGGSQLRRFNRTVCGKLIFPFLFKASRYCFVYSIPVGFANQQVGDLLAKFRCRSIAYISEIDPIIHWSARLL